MEQPSPTQRLTRRTLCGGVAAAAAGTAIAGPALVRGATADDDVRVLSLLVLIEYTEAAFYAQALEAGALDGELRAFAEVVAGHETAHLDVVKGALGSAAPPEPAFAFGAALEDTDAFVRAAGRLEDLAVSAYNGQAGNVTPKAFAVAARIVSVEARHAAWVRSIAGRDPAPDATDQALTEAQVRRGLTELGARL